MKTSFAVVLVACALSAAAAEKGAEKKEKPKNYVLTPAADLKWNDVPNMAGVKQAVLEGDPAKGPHHQMMKFDGGFTAGEHHHTSDHYVTVVAGTLVLTMDGAETKLPAGSYFQITKKTPHSTKCEAGADCILSLDVRGKWDVVQPKAEGKKEAKAEEKKEGKGEEKKEGKKDAKAEEKK